MINLYWGWDCIGGSGGMMGWNVYSAAGAGEEEDLFLSVSWVSYVMFTIFLFNLVRFAGACSCLHSDATWFINVVNASGIGSASSFAVICFKTTSFCCFMSDSDVPLHWQLMGQVKEFPQQLLHLTIQEGRQDVMYQLMVCQASTAVSRTVGVILKDHPDVLCHPAHWLTHQAGREVKQKWCQWTSQFYRNSRSWSLSSTSTLIM